MKTLCQNHRKKYRLPYLRWKTPGGAESMKNGKANICGGIKTNEVTLRKKIMADVDYEHFNLTKKIQKKYKLSWKTANSYVNWSTRVLMLSFPEKWLNRK